MSELRNASSGERLGNDYKPVNRLIIREHRYRMMMVIGAQQLVVKPILDDEATGTPQRLLWLPVSDNERPRIRPDEPSALILRTWPGFPIPNIDIRQFLDIGPDPADFEVLSFPKKVEDEIDAYSYDILDEDFEIDPLDSHKFQLQMKTAAGLMWLDQRHTGVSQEDWDLAGLVIEKYLLT